MPRRFLRSLSAGGLVLGTLFFAASLTPSLIPRTYLVQGALSGACFAAGYGIGVAWRWLWRYMELPEPRDRYLRAIKISAAFICTAIATGFLWQSSAWQNSIRAMMGLAPVTRAHSIEICLIAIVSFLALILLARLFTIVVRRLSHLAESFMPPRVARVIGISAAIVLFWTVANGFLLQTALHAIDSTYAELDGLFEPEQERPAEPFVTGSSASLLSWNELGRTGRRFIASGPTAAQIGALTEKPALSPIRVYAGLPAGETAGQRAKLALEELKRVGGFDRSILVVITPTGTGWVDPSAIDSLEYLHDGDVASVAMQYSYLSSPLSLIIEPDYGAEAARALFSVVYAYWTSLPKNHRPKLYLHGLSLGAMNSERSANFFEIIGDPIQGAVWSGPPFESSVWRQITEARNLGTPVWLPRFGDGSMFRFMNQNGSSVPADAPWGPVRIVYLQYASDAITFFDYRDAYRRPVWMYAPRGPDVSPQLRWFPVVTMLQLAFDMAVANSAPMGYGHVFAPEHYVDAWLDVTAPEGWAADRVARLKEHLIHRSGR
ncbi:alpha/beta-hydrolase family protein [Mesorhizobium sp. CAU 1732]|uniref:alpha/beta hydrolase n=1 Tax=Mesorhizobium sp. CAU 1732 TaxID=3140358 RepID=UPI0032600FF7